MQSEVNMLKTVCQYNKTPIPESDMDKLLEIAADYGTVKNYVYQRYGGIGGLSKIYPGYTVQNEMTESGLREQLDMPSVYFYLAIFDALGNIKTQWSKTRNDILEAVKKHETFSDDDKHYLRLVLKSDKVWDSVLNHRELHIDNSMVRAEYERLMQETDTHKLHQYLRRQTRKYHKKLHTDKSDSFTIGERAYRYADDGIYISTKQKRQRVYVPLTDSNRYKRQLKIILYSDESRLEIMVPVDVKTKIHADYTNKIGISLGVHTLLTTSDGQSYGGEYGIQLSDKADWISRQQKKYKEQRVIDTNPIGRKKYQNRKKKMDASIHSYINMQLNRFIQNEKPAVIYMPKLPHNSYGGNYGSNNYITTIWERGYIRNRLTQKCRENNIELIEVYAKNISSECSNCGAAGRKKDGMFYCGSCGTTLDEKINAAINAKNRGN
jgi:transposase